MPFSPDTRHRRIFLKRLRILWFLTIILFLILTARIGQWTLFRRRDYRKLARNNFIHPQCLSAPRGKIFSRDGKPLAVNRMTFSIWISPFRVKRDELHRTVSFLGHHLGRDFSRQEREALTLRPRWRGKIIARNLPIEKVAPILERQFELPGLRVHPDFKRFYPAGSTCAHVIGYLGCISRAEIHGYLKRGYSRDDLVGIGGIERWYEDLLKGTPGREVVQRDARGRYCKTLETQPAIPGQDLYLSLDLDFQKFALNALNERLGVVVVMNPQNGQILALVSSPSYDPNHPAVTTNPTRPISFLNKAIQENYSPASTFKLITAMAGLDSGISPAQKYFCDGYYYLPNWKKPFKCDLVTGHGWLDLRGAIQYSCNIYFYKSVRRIGVLALLQKALEFDYGFPTGIDLPYEVAGSLPLISADSLTPGEVLHLAIGQGMLAVTPLQVLCSYCAFANGGNFVQPHLLLYQKDAERRRKYFTPKTRFIHIKAGNRRAVLEGLIAVVNTPGGTAYKAGFPKEWKVAGKTGTAERASKKTDAWFACFAPYDAPEVAVLVLLESGGFGGRNAAPLAREILKYYFLNRDRLKRR